MKSGLPRTARLAAVLVVIMALGGVGRAVPTFATSCSAATLPGSTFEIDGNKTADCTGDIDWNAVDYFNVPDKVQDGTDNVFKQGTNEDTIDPTVAFNQANPKSDLSALELTEQVLSGHAFLFVGLDRLAYQGAAHEDFEFNQRLIRGYSGGLRVPLQRSDGDLLIQLDYLGSGAPSLAVWRWAATPASTFRGGACLSNKTTPCWSDKIVLPSQYGIAAVSSDGSFIEAGVNLTAAVVAPPSIPCQPSYSSFFAKGRASSSPSADVNDFVAPWPPAPDDDHCGYIHINGPDQLHDASPVLSGSAQAAFARGTANYRQVTVRHSSPVASRTFDGDVRRLRQMAPMSGRDKLSILRPAMHGEQLAPAATNLSPGTGGTMPGPTQSFPGLDFAGWGVGAPPDANGDVGPNDYVQAVNNSIGIFSKTGTREAAFTFDSLWSTAGTGTPCDSQNKGDPTVNYDPLGNRFIVGDYAYSSVPEGQFDTPVAPFYECIAVSKSGDPITGGWWLYAVRADDAAHPWLNDYPKMAIWPDGLYLTANEFRPSSGLPFREVRIWALNRQDLESGAALRSVVVDLPTSSDDGFFTLLPANMRTGVPPAGSPEYLVSESTSSLAWDVFKFHADYDGSGSTFSGPTFVSQTKYNYPNEAAASPTGGLESLPYRLMNLAQYSNVGGLESLWVNHTVNVTTGARLGIQWAQINVTGGRIAAPVQQQIYGNLNNDGVDRWLGSLAVDRNGDMALGYSASSAGLNPDIRYAGRLGGDRLGELPQGEVSMLGGANTGSEIGGERWGDYSAMQIDPDGCTFWYTNEYYAANGGDWQTRIGSFSFPSCTPLKSISAGVSHSAAARADSVSR